VIVVGTHIGEGTEHLAAHHQRNRHEAADPEIAKEAEVFRRADRADEQGIRHWKNKLSAGPSRDVGTAWRVVAPGRPPFAQLFRKRLMSRIRVHDRHAPDGVTLAQINETPRARVGEGEARHRGEGRLDIERRGKQTSCFQQKRDVTIPVRSTEGDDSVHSAPAPSKTPTKVGKRQFTRSPMCSTVRSAAGYLAMLSESNA
jgi:hypothetical protein